MQTQALLPDFDHTRIPRAVSPRAVMAIDPSLAGTAVAVHVPGAPPYEQRYATKPATSVHGRVLRYRSIATPIVELAIQHRPVLVLIEGYAFAAMTRGKGAGGQGTEHRSELGGILRDRLLDHCGQIVEVPPATLKKWATGKGNAQKSEVVSALSRRYDRAFRTDDAADAWALMTLGLALTGQADPENKTQAEVVRVMAAKMGERA